MADFQDQRSRSKLKFPCLHLLSIRLTSCMDYNGITLFIGAAALAINYTLFRCDPGRLNVYLPIVVVLASVREWWVACIFLEGNRGVGVVGWCEERQPCTAAKPAVHPIIAPFPLLVWTTNHQAVGVVSSSKTFGAAAYRPYRTATFVMLALQTVVPQVKRRRDEGGRGGGGGID